MRTITALGMSLLVLSITYAQNSPKADSTKKAVPVQATNTTAPASNLVVNKAVVALNVNNLEPENVADSFPAEVHRLYCFTQIKGANGPEEIQHRWYYKDELMGTVSLQINSGNFRTYSSKYIPEEMKGDWRVSIVSSKDESILKTIRFITH